MPPLSDVELRLRELQKNRSNTTISDWFVETIEAGRGKELFRALLSSDYRDDEETYRDYRRVMDLLESLIDTHGYIAGYLLVRLQPAAGKKKLHAIVDHIDLVLFETPVPAGLADAMKRLCVEGFRRKKCEQWLACYKS